MTVSCARNLLGLASLLLLAVVLWLSNVHLKPGGLETFDGRPLGYDLNAAREYLRALGGPARAVYLGPMRVLDTAFPLVFAAFLAMMMYRVTRGWTLVSQLLLLLLPGGYLVMDLAENALVADLLRTSLSDLRAGPVILASRFTVTKYVVLGMTVTLLFVLAVRGRR